MFRAHPKAAAALQRWSRLKLRMQKIKVRSPFKKSEKIPIKTAVQEIFNTKLVDQLRRMNYSDSVILRWRRNLSKLLPLGGSSVGNHVTVFSDGDAAFQEMWMAIEQAKESIKLEMYIFEPDVIGLRTLSLLQEACQRGVSVTLLYDAFGSSRLVGLPFASNPLDALRKAGAEVVAFNPIIKFWSWRRSAMFRNHRKILIVDDTIGFAGGMNIAAEYCGARLGGNARFRDTHMRIEGPAVADLHRVFLDSLKEADPLYRIQQFMPGLKLRQQRWRQRALERFRSVASRAEDNIGAMLERFSPTTTTTTTATSSLDSSDSSSSLSSASTSGGDLDTPIPSMVEVRHVEGKKLEPGEIDPTSMLSSPPAGDPVSSTPAYVFKPNPYDIFCQVLPSNVWRNKMLIQRAMNITIRSAKARCYITNPYFLPPLPIMRAIGSAANKGVDVRLLSCGEGRSDVPIVRLASYHIYERFLRQGVRIFELQSQVLHAKTVSIDGLYCSVGSFNMDIMSSKRNLEVNVTFVDPILAQALETQFFKDLENAKEVTLKDIQTRGWWSKLLHWFAYHITRFLSSFPI